MSLDASKRVQFSDASILIDEPPGQTVGKSTIPENIRSIIKPTEPFQRLVKKEITLVGAGEEIYSTLERAKEKGNIALISTILAIEFDEAGYAAEALEKFLSESNDLFLTSPEDHHFTSVELGFKILHRLADPSNIKDNEQKLLQFLYERELFTKEAVECYIRIKPSHYNMVNSLWQELSGTARRTVPPISTVKGYFNKEDGSSCFRKIGLTSYTPPIPRVASGREDSRRVVTSILKHVETPSLYPFECDKVTKDDGVDANPVHKILLDIKAEDDRRSAWNCYYYLWENWRSDEEWTEGVINFFHDENHAFSSEFNCAHSVLFAVVTCRYFADMDRDTTIAILKFLLDNDLLTDELLRDAQDRLPDFRYTINHLAHDELFANRYYQPHQLYGSLDRDQILRELNHLKEQHGPNFVYDYLCLYWRQTRDWGDLVVDYFRQEEGIVVTAMEDGNPFPENGICPLHFLIALSSHLNPHSEKVSLELTLEIFWFILRNFKIYTDELTDILTDYNPPKEPFSLAIPYNESGEESFSPSFISRHIDEPETGGNGNGFEMLLQEASIAYEEEVIPQSPPKRRNAIFIEGEFSPTDSSIEGREEKVEAVSPIPPKRRRVDSREKREQGFRSVAGFGSIGDAQAGRSRGDNRSPGMIEKREMGTMTPSWNAVADFHNSLFLRGGEDAMTVAKVIFLWIGMIATLSLLYWGLYWQANSEDARRLDGRVIAPR